MNEPPLRRHYKWKMNGRRVRGHDVPLRAYRHREALYTAGFCEGCGEPITVGQNVAWAPGIVYHEACWATAIERRSP